MLTKPAHFPAHLKRDNLPLHRRGKRRENKSLGNAGQKFGAEGISQSPQHCLFHARKTGPRHPGGLCRAKVRSESNVAIPQVNLPSGGEGDASGIKHLDKQVENLGVRLFQLIKKQDEGPVLAHYAAKCPRIAGIRSEQPFHGIDALEF